MAIAKILGLDAREAIELADQLHTYGDMTHTLFFCGVGPGPFRFGKIPFSNFGDLVDNVTETARVENLPGGYCRGFGGTQTLALHFPERALYKDFIEVTNFPDTGKSENFRIQISGKNTAWHSCANRSLYFSNQSLTPGLAPSRQEIVSNTDSHRLVDYVFSDFNELQKFLTQVNEKTFDAEVARMAILWGPRQ